MQLAPTDSLPNRRSKVRFRIRKRSLMDKVLCRPIPPPIEIPIIRFNAHKAEYHGQHPWSSNYCGGKQEWRNHTARETPRFISLYSPETTLAPLKEYLKFLDDPLTDRFRFENFLDATDVIEIQQVCSDQRKVRDQTRAEASHLREQAVNYFPLDAHIMQQKLHIVLLYASTPIIYHGHTHDIPIVIRSCIDQLSKIGVFENNLFAKKPNRARLIELVDIFNTGPSFGERFNILKENTNDVVGLLHHFVRNLGEPILPAIMFYPLWEWCTKPTTKRDADKRLQQESAELCELERRLAKTTEIIPRSEFVYVEKPLVWTDEEIEINEKWERRQLKMAVWLFKMLPCANLSLAAYLFDFFTLVVQTSKNDVQYDDIANIYTQDFIGGVSRFDSHLVMVWILERWERISDGVFLDHYLAYEERTSDDPEPPLSFLQSPTASASGKTSQVN